jgi:tetratricopeptide (TPR) repeat protein
VSRLGRLLPPASIFLIALGVRLVALRLSFDESNLFGKYWALGQELRESHLLADRPFSYAPIYCYFIALGQMVLGDSPYRVLVAQAFAGAASCALLYRIARPLVGPRWAWLPGLAACLFRSFVLYDLTLLSDALGLLFQLAVLVVLGRPDPEERWGRQALAGLGIGLAALHRPNNLLLLAIVLAIGFARGGLSRTSLRNGAVLAGAALLTTLPVVLQNVRSTGTPGITASNPGYIFYSSNNAASFGFRYSPPELYYRGFEYYRRLESTEPSVQFVGDAEIATVISGAVLGHPMSLSESSRYWAGFTLAHMGRYPRYYASLALRRLWLTFHGYESHDVAPVFSLHDKIATITPIRFAWIAPLGLLGLALSVPRWREAVWLCGVLANNLALLGVFYVVSRFRLPLEAALLVTSAVALQALWGWARERRMRALLASGVALAGLYLACNSLPADLAERARYRELEVRLEDAGRLVSNGDLEHAAALLEELIERDDEELPRIVAAHRMLAQIYASRGVRPGGTAMKDPSHFEPHAVTARLAGKRERGAITFAELRYLAFLYRSRGDREREQEVLREALARRPPEPLSRYELAQAQLASGQPGAAKTNLLDAERDGLLFTTRGIHGAFALARIFEAEGNGAAARSWTDQAVRLSALAPWYPDDRETLEILERLRESPGQETPARLEQLVPLGRRRRP